MHLGTTNQVGYGFFNTGIMIVAPNRKVPRKRACGKKGKKGKKGRKWKRSNPQARRVAMQPMVAVVKGERQGHLPPHPGAAMLRPS